MLELIKLDDSIKLDIRYARTDNFIGRPVYGEARAFLQKEPAEALVRIHRKLKDENLGLVIFDGYRPWSVTKLFWETVREDQRIFVADPIVGSIHNRGCAVDLSLFDLETGRIIEMPSDYDEFNEKAFADYAGGTQEQRTNRNLLIDYMETEDFTVNPKEWWHFDFKNWKKYEILDIPFTGLEKENFPQLS